MTKQTRDYVDIGLAIESILAGFGNPEVESVSIDAWEISLRTREPLPGVEYETTTHHDYIIRRGAVHYADLVIKMVHVERGKVVPA